MVRNVKKYMTDSDVELYSESFRVLGIIWQLNVEISTDKTNR